jgi:glycosyltransferase involved in cell wall biosynthesis
MKLAIVVQRYGSEVNGGAEYHARLLAERLSTKHSVTVLSTCALDYVSWKNHYPAGDSKLENVEVKRFKVIIRRFKYLFDRLYDIVAFVVKVESAIKDRRSRGPMSWQLRLKVGIAAGLLKIYDLCFRNLIESLWMLASGPLTPSMSKYIRAHRDSYDCFIFFSFMYPTTFENLKLVREKAILIPTAHREPGIYQHRLRAISQRISAILFNTPEEKSYFFECFPESSRLPHDVVGIGLADIKTHSDTLADSLQTSAHQPYILYIGRIEIFKGCETLFDFFRRYKDAHGGTLKLLLIGTATMPLPNRSDIIHLGFVSDQEKIALLESCELLVMPSAYESLSMVVLEAWSQKKPVLVNGLCEVLVGQVQRSGGGQIFSDYNSFATALSSLTTDREKRASMGELGYRYYQAFYQWESILSRVEAMILRVSKKR